MFSGRNEDEDCELNEEVGRRAESSLPLISAVSSAMMDANALMRGKDMMEIRKGRHGSRSDNDETIKVDAETLS